MVEPHKSRVAAVEVAFVPEVVGAERGRAGHELPVDVVVALLPGAERELAPAQRALAKECAFV